MEFFQKQNNRSEQILLLLLTASSSLPRNPISDRGAAWQTLSKKPSRTKKKIKMKTLKKKNKGKNTSHSLFSSYETELELFNDLGA